MIRSFILIALACLLFSCIKEVIPPENEGKVLAEAEIGRAGAVLEAEGLSITVPPGTFSGTYKLQISLEEEFTDDFGENGASRTFRIDGMPSVTSGYLFLAIKYEGTLEDESYVALGGIETIQKEEEAKAVSSYSLYEVTDSSGYLVARIPPLEGDQVDESALKSTLGIVPFSMIANAITRMISWEGSYFKLTCPYKTDGQKINQLLADMDKAMQTFFEMRLADQGIVDAMIMGYGRPRVVVTNDEEIQFLDYNVRMPFLAECALEDHGKIPLERYSRLLKININISRSALEMASEKKLTSYAYLWVYRMVYYLYFGDRMDWFAYASALWMQEKYAGVSDYIPALFSVDGMSPFKGMEAGKKEYTATEDVYVKYGGRIFRNMEFHAMGMYPFVKYLDQRFPDDKELFVRIMREILWSESKTAMEGIINAVEEPEYLWWPAFFEQFLTRQLVDQPADAFLKTLTPLDQINFKHETDSTWLSDADYADLSARLYKVNFLFPEFQNEASLNLKVGPSSLNMDYITTLAFGVKGNTLEYFDRSANLTVPNLKTLRTSGYSSILVAVVNSASEPTTDEKMHIELDTRLQTVPDFNYVVIQSIIARCTNTDIDGLTQELEYWYYQDPRKGELIDHTFTATWSEPWCEGCDGINSGTIIVEFDPDRFPEYITRFYIHEITDEDAFIHTSTIVGENLDLQGTRDPAYQFPHIRFKYSGVEVCNYVTSMTETYTAYDGTILSHSVDGTVRCDQDSQFDMTLYYQSSGK